jgi:phage-related baseplate assembly protein
MKDLNFVETDSGVILNTILQALENGCSEPLYPGDERRVFGESALAPLFVSLFSAVNDGCRQKMLRYARDDVLDALGENQHVKRYEPVHSKATLRFYVSEPATSNITIPAGIRATSDYSRYFSTVQTVVLQAGSTYIEVEATATEGGASYNNIAIGAINIIVDTSEAPLIDGVTNITASANGADKEQDDAYRERIRNSDNARSTAGPAAAYRYWAIAADPTRISDAVVESEVQTLERELTIYYNNNASTRYAFMGGNHLDVSTLVVYPHGSNISASLTTDYTITYTNNLLIITIITGGALAAQTSIDITVEETQEGSVVITPVCYGGEIPDNDLLALVYENCNNSEVRPLTDLVTVQPPSIESYDIDIMYYTTTADEAACVETVEGAGGAIDRYIYWQGSNLSRDINPDYLRKLILAPNWDGAVGATMVIINAPAYTDLPSTTLAKWSGNIIVSHMVKEGVV